MKFFDIVFSLFLALGIGLFFFMGLILVDEITAKDIGEESVSCLDEKNRPFENEMCTKTITCSWLGLGTYTKCAEVHEDGLTTEDIFAYITLALLIVAVGMLTKSAIEIERISRRCRKIEDELLFEVDE